MRAVEDILMAVSLWKSEMEVRGRVADEKTDFLVETVRGMCEVNYRIKFSLNFLWLGLNLNSFLRNELFIASVCPGELNKNMKFNSIE